MTVTTADLLDLNVGVRSDSFVFELLDNERNKIDELAVIETAAPVVRFDTTRTVMRTCTGLTIQAAALDLDVRKHRVRPTMKLQNGDVKHLGVLMFGADNRKPSSSSVTWTPDLFDETFILDQPLSQSVGVVEGGSVLALLTAIVQSLGLTDIDLSGVHDAPASSSLVYAAGTPANDAVVALAAILGCYPPFFNNEGTYRIKPAPPAGSTAEHIFELGGRLIEDGTTITNNAFKAYNRYQVISQDAANGQIVGLYDLPPSAPNSYENIGFRVTQTQNQQGIPTGELASLAAYINALTDRNSYVQASWSSTADARHDGFDLCQLYGVQYQETGWSIECKSGGVMTHTGVGFYN